MNYVIIGGDAAGMSAAMEIVRGNKEAKITVLEKGEIYSYAQCGLPYIIDGRIAKTEDLLARSLHVFRNKYGIDARIGHEVDCIDVHNQFVSGVTASGDMFKVFYDKLLIATGVRPIIPQIKNNTLRGLHTIKTIPQMEDLMQDLVDVQRAVVVGGGYIGLEVTETLKEKGVHVTLIQQTDRLMPVLPRYMSEKVLQQAQQHQIEVLLETEVTEIIGTEHVEAIVAGGKICRADLVIFAVGVVPNTEFIDAEKLRNGALIVNEQMETSVSNVYAAGDCAAHYHRVFKDYTHLPLGTTANKQGRIAGRAMIGVESRFAGVVGTSILKFLDMDIGVTGMSENDAKKYGFEYDSYDVETMNRAGYYPTAEKIFLRIMVQKETNRLLGLQAVGKGVDKRIDVFATALYQQLTFEQLLELDLAYAPPFNSVWDPIQQIAKRYS